MATATKKPTPTKAPKPSKAEAWVDATDARACLRIGMACFTEHTAQAGIIGELLADACRVQNADGTVSTATHDQLKVPPMGSLAAKAIGRTPDENAQLCSRLSTLFVVGLTGLVDLAGVAAVGEHPEQLAAAIRRDLAELKMLKAKAASKENLLPETDDEGWVSGDDKNAATLRPGLPFVPTTNDGLAAVITAVGRESVAGLDNNGYWVSDTFDAITVPMRGSTIDRMVPQSPERTTGRDPFYDCRERMRLVAHRGMAAFEAWEGKDEEAMQGYCDEFWEAWQTASCALDNIGMTYCSLEAKKAVAGGEA